MKDLIDEFTWKAVKHHADGATLEYYRRLREEKKFYTTRCTGCATTSYPPRPFCPSCFCEDVEWVDVGSSGGATLYAFTTQKMSLRFMAPDVIGVVDIPGVGRVISKINGKLSDLQIGQKLRFEPFEISEDMTVHSFTPIQSETE
jgi:uncharacterized protein